MTSSEGDALPQYAVASGGEFNNNNNNDNNNSGDDDEEYDDVAAAAAADDGSSMTSSQDGGERLRPLLMTSHSTGARDGYDAEDGGIQYYARTYRYAKIFVVSTF